MTQLLISVKNEEEALIALNCGVDMIDLKDPNTGALGALDMDISRKILQKVRDYKQSRSSTVLTSATVGEAHVNTNFLIQDIKERIEIGVDIIKIPITSLFNLENHLLNAEKMRHFIVLSRAKLIAVFFADQSIDFSLLDILKSDGFYGAMVDTANKQKSLLEISSLVNLQMFTQLCKKNALKSGLAGSLKPQHIEQLIQSNPSYIGFRGGVCTNDSRVSGLEPQKIDNIRNMLQ